MKTKLYALVQQYSVAKNNDVKLSLRDASEKAGEEMGYLERFHIVIALKISLSSSFILWKLKLEIADQEWQITSVANIQRKCF